VVRAGTAAAPLRCRFRLAQSSGCAWCVYRRNHRPRLLVSATPNPTCDRFAGHGGTDRGPTLPCNRLSCFLSGWARIVAALKANPKPAQVARAIGGVHHTTVWQITRAEGIRLAHPRRRRHAHAHTDSQGVDPPNLAQASPATIPNSRRGERMRSCRRDCARARPIGKSRSASASFASLARDSGTPGQPRKSFPCHPQIFSAKKQQI
jgi:hypothetical protein